MSWCWFAHLPKPGPEAVDLSEALASAAVADPDGAPAGLVAAWPRGRKPVRSAARMDRRVVDPGGPPAWLSLVLVPPELAPLFDDPAVSQAMRRVLAGPPFAAVSTLVRDAVHFAGAVTVEQGPSRAASPTTRSRCCTRPASCASGRACSAPWRRRPGRSSSATPAGPSRWLGSTATGSARHGSARRRPPCRAACRPAGPRLRTP